VKSIVTLFLVMLSSAAMAGTLTIIPDSTSSMGIQQQKREAAEKARAERQARIAAGIEQPPPVIIIRQAPQYQPPPKTHFDCQSYGYNNSRMSCD
jgi:hypothetical protein